MLIPFSIYEATVSHHSVRISRSFGISSAGAAVVALIFGDGRNFAIRRTSVNPSSRNFFSADFRPAIIFSAKAAKLGG